MMKRLTLIAALTLLAITRSVFAASGSPLVDEQKIVSIDDVHAAHPTELHYSHPTLPPFYASWAGAMLIVVAGMFLAAAVIGPVIRAEMPEEVPDAHSHDEPPGTSGHHGASGTVAPTPDHHH